MKKLSIFLSVLAVSWASYAQIGGSTTYNFLRLAPSARVSGLGEINITCVDYDPAIQLANPAALNPAMHRHVFFSTVVHPGGINYGTFGYVHDAGKRGTFGGGLQYMTYGKIAETDENGIASGRSIAANEFSLFGGGSYRFGKIFSVGANAKLIYSALDIFRSFGMAADLGVTINDTAHRIIASVVAKNIGGEIAPYNSSSRQAIPFDLQAGISVGFKGFPVRFHITFHDLHRWNLRYDNPADRQSETLFTDSTQTSSKSSGAADEFFRHLIVGAELNIKKVVYISIAYNHQRRQETLQETRRSLAGINFGLGVHVKQFSIGIGLMPMPLKNTLAHFTFSVNTAGFIRKVKKP